MKTLLLLTSFLSLAATGLSAQDVNPVEWTTSFSPINKNEVKVTFEANIEDGWMVYSQFLESDDAPLATQVHLDESISATAEIMRSKEFTSKKQNRYRGWDKLFKMPIVKYKHDLTIVVRIKAADMPIKGYLQYMSCDATRCMPPRYIEFEYPSSRS